VKTKEFGGEGSRGRRIFIISFLKKQSKHFKDFFKNMVLEPILKIRLQDCFSWARENLPLHVALPLGLGRTKVKERKTKEWEK